MYECVCKVHDKCVCVPVTLTFLFFVSSIHPHSMHLKRVCDVLSERLTCVYQTVCKSCNGLCGQEHIPLHLPVFLYPPVSFMSVVKVSLICQLLYVVIGSSPLVKVTVTIRRVHLIMDGNILANF